MRVVFFSRNARFGDAIGQQLLAKLRYFQQQGAQVRVFLSEDQDILPEVKATSSIILSAQHIWNNPQLRSELQSAQWLFAEFGSSYDLMNLLPALAGKGPKIIVNYHGLTPFELADPAFYPDLEAAHNQRRLLWCADRVLVHSRFAGEELKQAIGLPEERIHQIPCWLNLESVHLTKKERDSLRSGIGASNAHVILFVGRLAKNKQPETILKALTLLADAEKPIHVVYLGDHGDIYAENYQRCRDLARQLGVEQKVHFLGKVDAPALNAWYQAADVLVLPSLHECFGMPVVEAMARGLPVVCADQGALPETLGHAGITFLKSDPTDLAQQLHRLLEPAKSQLDSPSAWSKRIALVTHRFGSNFAGGAEKSLRLMAQAWQSRGWSVEVFTTCNQHESRWRSTLPVGSRTEDDFLVHRFLIDPYDEQRLSKAYQDIQQCEKVSDELQEEYLANSLSSHALLDELQKRKEEFAAIVTGPYLFKLTYEVANQFSEQVLVAPCFHDEPLAYLPIFQQVYRQVGGLLFHSEGEASFTAERLAINHPRHSIVGTVLEQLAFVSGTALPNLAARTATGGTGKAVARNNLELESPYVVYCGRYCPEKGLGDLLDYMMHFQAQRPSRLKLVFMGQGPMQLPKRSWLIDLGFVSEESKRNVIAGALALVNLSQNESLSIVALEAWALSVPVIVTKGCEVLSEQVNRSKGGAIIQSKEDLERILMQWLEDDFLRKKHGQAGLQFVRENYSSLEKYAKCLEEAVLSLRTPLSELARQRGLERAQQFSTQTWERCLAQFLENEPARSHYEQRPEIKVIPLQESLQIPVGETATSITVRLINVGQSVLPSHGPARIRLSSEVIDQTGAPAAKRRCYTELPEVLIPGQDSLLAVAVPLPRKKGAFKIRLSVIQGQENSHQMICQRLIPLRITKRKFMPTSNQTLAPLVQSAKQTLAQAQRLERLPEDYMDVTEGSFSSAKRLIKRKLLNNFRRAYIDVAFRQQSALNQKLINVMNLLLESLSLQSGSASISELQQELRKLQRQYRRERKLRRHLERRLNALIAPEISG